MNAPHFSHLDATDREALHKIIDEQNKSMRIGAWISIVTGILLFVAATLEANDIIQSGRTVWSGVLALLGIGIFFEILGIWLVFRNWHVDSSALYQQLARAVGSVAAVQSVSVPRRVLDHVAIVTADQKRIIIPVAKSDRDRVAALMVRALKFTRVEMGRMPPIQ